MREIKFRGMSNDGWVYGSFTHVHDEGGNPSIIQVGDNRFTSVAKTSIGQFTGLLDKQGIEIHG